MSHFWQAVAHLTTGQLVSILAHIVFTCSLITALAPPIEWFNSKPKFQAKYRFALMILQYYGALNLRAKLWGGQFQQNQPPAPPQPDPEPQAQGATP